MFLARAKLLVKLSFNKLIFQGVAGTRTANCCFPAIARNTDGELFVTWRVGSRKDSVDGAIWLARSNDAGLNWSSPREVFGPSSSDGEWIEPHYGPLTILDDGRLLAAVMWVHRRDEALPLFNPKTEGILPLRTVIHGSSDDGLTWNALSKVDSEPYSGPLAITGPLRQLPNGELACQFEVNKEYDDTRPWRHAAALKFSGDGGRTWPECREVANDPRGQLMFWDARIVSTGGRECLAAFWTFDRENHCDRRVHLARSHDAGRTWSRPRESDVVGQVAEPVPLGDNRLVLIVVDRFATRGIHAHLSTDQGQSFVESQLIYQQPAGATDAGHQVAPADYLQDMELWTFGRVQAVAGSAGRLWVVYYAGDANRTGIYCARLEV